MAPWTDKIDPPSELQRRVIPRLRLSRAQIVRLLSAGDTPQAQRWSPGEDHAAARIAPRPPPPRATLRSGFISSRSSAVDCELARRTGYGIDTCRREPEGDAARDDGDSMYFRREPGTDPAGH